MEETLRRIVREEVRAALADVELGSREWYTAEAAADYIGTTRGVVYSLVSSGRLPRHGEKGSKLMFARATLDAYLENPPFAHPVRRADD